MWNGSRSDASSVPKRQLLITRLLHRCDVCVSPISTLLLPLRLLPIDAVCCALRASASAPQHYLLLLPFALIWRLAAERKRLMPNACCARLIPRRVTKKDARGLHFSPLDFHISEVRNAMTIFRVVPLHLFHFGFVLCRRTSTVCVCVMAEVPTMLQRD